MPTFFISDATQAYASAPETNPRQKEQERVFEAEGERQSSSDGEGCF